MSDGEQRWRHSGLTKALLAHSRRSCELRANTGFGLRNHNIIDPVNASVTKSNHSASRGGGPCGSKIYKFLYCPIYSTKDCPHKHALFRHVCFFFERNKSVRALSSGLHDKGQRLSNFPQRGLSLQRRILEKGERERNRPAFYKEKRLEGEKLTRQTLAEIKSTRMTRQERVREKARQERVRPSPSPSPAGKRRIEHDGGI